MGRRGGGRSVSSSRSSGLRTASGHAVRSAAAYAATGAKTYTNCGKTVRSPENYAKTVQGNSMKAAAAKVRKDNPGAKAFTYTANLASGKKYVGQTANPGKRIHDHHSGHGASATKKYAPESVTFTPHRSVRAAKAAETATYYHQKNAHGGDKVRGAGHTKGFD